MNTHVLDASALLALLKEEPGAARVEANVSEALMTSVNLGEVAQRQFRLGVEREHFERLVEALLINIVPVNTDLAVTAAEFREKGRSAGLSQADCICLALGKRAGLPVLTADRAWPEVGAALGVEVQLIR